MPPSVPLGDGEIEISLPDCSVTVCEPPGATPVDPAAAARRAIESPHGERLSSIADPADDVVIVVTDVTRATPDDVLVDALVSELQAAGVARSQVTIVLGLGLHRPMTDTEIRDGLGEYADLAVNHDPERTVSVGTVEGCSIEVNERVADADCVVSTGMVEPHQYAGFSGGAKTVVVGAGGESAIRYSHGAEMLGREGVRLGRIDDNPFRAFIDAAGDLVGVDFALNVTHSPRGILDAAAGKPRAVVADLAETAREALAVSVEGEYDAVIAGVPAPKDANLYQTSRAPTYLALGAHNPLSSDGRIVVPSRMSEGVGEGTGERRFKEWLGGATDPSSLYAAMAEGYEPGAQRAFVLARVLRDHDVWITNSEHPDIVEECLMKYAPTVAEAIDPGSRVLVVPDALTTLLTR